MVDEKEHKLDSASFKFKQIIKLIRLRAVEFRPKFAAIG